MGAKKDIYVYPAIFYYEENQIAVLFPDFPGCGTSGKSDEEALRNAKEALSGHILCMEEDNEEIPDPTPLKQVEPEYNDCISRIILVEVYMINYREAYENRSIKKTLTIPYWMNKVAEAKGINFSQTLQEALKEKIYSQT